MQNASTFNLSMMALVGATALSTTMFTSLAGCAGDEFTVGTPDPDAGIGGGDAGDGGNGGDAGTVVPGTQYIPSSVRPSLAQKLPPTRAFLLWSAPSAVPEGKSIDHYDVCWTNGSFADISDPSQCPNATTPKKTYGVVDSLKAGATYYWKTRASYADGWTSDYSTPFAFSTDSSVLAWWKFDEGTGTSAADSSGLLNNASLKNGPSWVPGRVGSAIQLDGSNDYLLVGDQASLEGMSQLTLEAWVRTTSSALNRPILSKWFTGTESYVLRLSPDTAGAVDFSTYTAAEVNNKGAILVNDGNWHHLMGTFDGLTQSLFIDLNADGSTTQTGTIANSEEEVSLGDFVNGTPQGYNYNGLIDEVVIYNRALSSAQRTNSFCATQAAGGVDPLPAACLP